MQLQVSICSCTLYWHARIRYKAHKPCCNMPTYCPQANHHHPYNNLLSLHMHACIDCCTIARRCCWVDIHSTIHNGTQIRRAPTYVYVHIRTYIIIANPNDAKLYSCVPVALLRYDLFHCSLFLSLSLYLSLFLCVRLSPCNDKSKKKKNFYPIWHRRGVFLLLVQKCIYTLAQCDCFFFRFWGHKQTHQKQNTSNYLWQAAGI